MTVAYIYALVDPFTEEVRYIGKTINPRQRLIDHCNEGMKGNNPYKMRWIAKLKAQGVKPKMVILEECPYDAWEDPEKRWIAYYRSIGARLTNVTDGGRVCRDFQPRVPLATRTPKNTVALRPIRLKESEYAFLVEMSDGTKKGMHGVLKQAIQALKREVEKEKKAAKKKEKGSK